MRRKGKHGIKTNGSIRRAIVIRDYREPNEKQFRWIKSYRKKPPTDGDGNVKTAKCSVDKKHPYCSRCCIRNCWDPLPEERHIHRLRRMNQKIDLNKMVKKYNYDRDPM